MGKATGIFLILAGIGTAALVLPRVDSDAEKQLADVVRIATGSVPPSVPPSVPSATFPPPASPVALQASVASRTSPASISARGASSRGEQEVTSAAPQSLPQTQNEAVVVAPPVLVAPPQPVVRNAAPMRTDDAQGRQALARDIQKELKRVGCYDGEISGEWTAATKRAMAQFISRLNAALPSDEPDHILRAMVHGYPGNACGRAAPSVTVAQGASKAAPRAADQPARDIATARPSVPKPAWETSVVAVPAAPMSKEGRMAMGGPVAVAPAPSVTGSIPSHELKPITPFASHAAIGVTNAPSIAMPGTIAALSGAVLPPEQGVRAAARSDDLAAAERRARQRERERERQRAASEPGPFPQAYRLGATPQRYFASDANLERGNFTQRFFARQRSGYDSR